MTHRSFAERDTVIGADLTEVWSEVDALTADVAAVQANDASDAASIATLQTQVAQLSTPAPFDLQGLIVVGNAVVANNVYPPGPQLPDAITLTSLSVRVGTAPSGSPLTVRFNLGGQSIGTVNVAAGATSGSLTVNVAATADQVVTWDVTAVGSTVPGADVWVRLVGTR